jgi:hypothetical protein
MRKLLVSALLILLCLPKSPFSLNQLSLQGSEV